MSKNNKNRWWLFLLSAWACYLRWAWKKAQSVIGVENAIVTDRILPSSIRGSVGGLSLMESEIGLGQSSVQPEVPHKLEKISDKISEDSSLIVFPPSEIKREIVIPAIGSSMALAGRCQSPDYGSKFFYIKTKHTGSANLAGILRRVGAQHSMNVADPPHKVASFKSEIDFHQIAQGKVLPKVQHLQLNNNSCIHLEKFRKFPHLVSTSLYINFKKNI
jgi:hypothetical protein